MAKEGNNEGCKILAKQLVAMRKQKNRVYSANSKVITTMSYCFKSYLLYLLYLCCKQCCLKTAPNFECLLTEKVKTKDRKYWTEAIRKSIFSDREIKYFWGSKIMSYHMPETAINPAGNLYTNFWQFDKRGYIWFILICKFVFLGMLMRNSAGLLKVNW